MGNADLDSLPDVECVGLFTVAALSHWQACCTFSEITSDTVKSSMDRKALSLAKRESLKWSLLQNS